MNAGFRLATHSSSSSSVVSCRFGCTVGPRLEVSSAARYRRLYTGAGGKLSSNAARRSAPTLDGRPGDDLRVVDGAMLQLMDDGHRGEVTGRDRAVRPGTTGARDLPRGAACRWPVRGLATRREIPRVQGISVTCGPRDAELHAGHDTSAEDTRRTPLGRVRLRRAVALAGCGTPDRPRRPTGRAQRARRTRRPCDAGRPHGWPRSGSRR